MSISVNLQFVFVALQSKCLLKNGYAWVYVYTHVERTILDKTASNCNLSYLGANTTYFIFAT